MSDTNSSPPDSENAEKEPLHKLAADETAADAREQANETAPIGQCEQAEREADAESKTPDPEEQLQAANDRLLRTQAELENYRKRVRREMDAERRYAAAPLIRDLLGVLDNLDLAIGAAQNSDNAAGLLEGVKMVAAQLQSVLEQHHCRRIDAVGQQFDPNFHEAVAHEPSDEYSADQITRVARVGYQLHDRVIRPSQVHVSSGSPVPDQPTVQE